MKPVHQPNCLACFAGALASILEIDPLRIDRELYADKRPSHTRTSDMTPVEYLPWLAKYGLSLLCTTPGYVEERWLDQYYIGVGVSPRDSNVMHAVVCFRGTIVWDPYKGNSPRPVCKILYCYFITALSPEANIPPEVEKLCHSIGGQKDGELTKTTGLGENPLPSQSLPVHEKRSLVQLNQRVQEQKLNAVQKAQ